MSSDLLAGALVMGDPEGTEIYVNRFCDVQVRLAPMDKRAFCFGQWNLKHISTSANVQKKKKPPVKETGDFSDMHLCTTTPCGVASGNRFRPEGSQCKGFLSGDSIVPSCEVLNLRAKSPITDR